MKIKSFIQLFIPPIYYRVKSRIKYDIPILQERQPKEDLVYYAINEINQRYDLKLNDLEMLSREPKFGGSHQVVLGSEHESGYYGVFYIMQKYAGIPFQNFPPRKLRIQHGHICEMLEWEKSKLEKINWVWSQYVKNMYTQYTDNPHIEVVGAPFFYADPIMSEAEILKEKKRLGRNLLAFPSHSTAFADSNFDKQSFINVLKSYQSEFDSIRICVYWADYRRGLAEQYQKAGFECVCCGHIADPFFLERQKALFLIADATISNDIGSHVGFSIYMNKPHLLIPSNIEYKDIIGDLVVVKEGNNLRKNSGNYKEICSAFIGNTDFLITDEQREIVDKYWGISSVKSPDEIRALIEEAYKISDEL